MIRRARPLLGPMLTWYFREVHTDGQEILFYCDPDRVSTIAIDPIQLAAGDEAALFRVFVTLSMYQALRDVVIMRQQRSLQPTRTTRQATGLRYNKGASRIGAARRRTEAVRARENGSCEMVLPTTSTTIESCSDLGREYLI